MLPDKTKEIYIILTTKTESVYIEERDYGESWGPSPAHTSYYDRVVIEVFENKSFWIKAIERLEKNGTKYYAGKTMPAKVEFSIKVD